MKSANAFLQTLNNAEQNIKHMTSDAKIIRQLIDAHRMDEAYAVSLRLAKYAERAALLARTLPVNTNRPCAFMDVQELMENNIPVDIGFTAEGWFYVKLPTLLPKKEFNSRSYIRAYLYPALQRFFDEHDAVRYDDAVLVFRHVYDRSRPERRMRDHDNIEVNTVSDAIALFVLADDSPAFCSHYYCSAEGSADFTQVYVVPHADFPHWLRIEALIEDSEGEKYAI
jgi:hypothetical protein